MALFIKGSSRSNGARPRTATTLFANHVIAKISDYLIFSDEILIFFLWLSLAVPRAVRLSLVSVQSM